MWLREAPAGEGCSRGFVDDAVRRAHGHGEGGRPTCCFVQVDVLEVRQVLACAHEVQECRRVDAGRLARLGIRQVRGASRRGAKCRLRLSIMRVCECSHEWSRRPSSWRDS
jgi:hypothetical protein